jgi:hypothetical protein
LVECRAMNVHSFLGTNNPAAFATISEGFTIVVVQKRTGARES